MDEVSDRLVIDLHPTIGHVGHQPTPADVVMTVPGIGPVVASAMVTEDVRCEPLLLQTKIYI